MKPSTANLLLLLAGAVWGMGFIAQQSAMSDIGPMLFITLRFLLAGIAVAPLAMAELRLKHNGNAHSVAKLHGRSFLLVGSIFFLGMAFQQVGLQTTSVTNAGFLTALYVVIVPILMTSVLRVRQPLIIWPAALLAITGIYLLSGGDLSTLNSGDGLVILCALFWSCHVILTGRVGHATGLPVTMACSQFFITSLLALAAFLLSISFSLGEVWPTFNQLTGASVEIFYAGLIAGALAFTLQAVGQRYTSESAAAIMLSTECLFAALFGALLLGDRLTSLGYLGSSMIFVAILLVELMPKKATATEPIVTPEVT